MTHGKKFELYVLAIVRDMLTKGKLALDPRACELFHHRRYRSDSGIKSIEADVSVEVRRPGERDPFLIVIWECKHYKEPVGEAAVKKFFSDIQEIGASRVKGYVVTPIGFSRWALRYSRKHGIGLWRIAMPAGWDIDPTTKTASAVNAAEPTSHLESWTGEAGCLAALGLMFVMAAVRPQVQDYPADERRFEPKSYSPPITEGTVFRVAEILLPPKETYQFQWNTERDALYVSFTLNYLDVLDGLTDLDGLDGPTCLRQKMVHWQDFRW